MPPFTATHRTGLPAARRRWAPVWPRRPASGQKKVGPRCQWLSWSAAPCSSPCRNGYSGVTEIVKPL